MNRDKWIFNYKSSTVLEAAIAKKDFHTGRLEFWRGKKDEAKAKIKAEGIDFSESVSDIFSNNYHDASVKVDNQLLKDFQECVHKEKEHHGKVEEYESWCKVLSTASQSLELNHEDFLYFFGK